MTPPRAAPFALSVVFAPAVLAFASVLSAAEPQVIELWPAGKVPGEPEGAVAALGEEKFVEPKTPEKTPIKRLTNVTKPTITVYRPAKEKDTGAAVVIAPGGGYSILAISHEGTDVAEWLVNEGVTAVLLKYRVPRRPGDPKDAPPRQALMDAQRALGLVRSKAGEWGVDPKRIGLLGFSAGGHLTAWASTNCDHRAYEPVDEADKVSCRPDFAVAIYAGGVIAKDTLDLKPEIRVGKDTPPMFLVHSHDDRGGTENSIALYLALKRAGVSAEMHLYSTGGHGFGMKKTDSPSSTWPQRCAEWMRKSGYLTPPTASAPSSAAK